jgi:predicted enzyme related to lactoylglutathione lyase
MSHAVNWFSIQGPNGHALQQFYKQVFGWAMKPMPGPSDMMMVPAEKDGIPGGVGASMNHQPSVAVYVSVGDIDAVFGKIQRSGGRMAMPKSELPNDMGSIAGFTDPAGNWVGLWMPPAKAAAPKRSAAPKKKKKSGAKAPAKAAAKEKAVGAKSNAKTAAAKKTRGATSTAKKK